jgi:hypothetical protein
MTYIVKKIDQTYVVWFAPANRYMQLQEPAFRILEDWSNKLPKDQIIRNCAHEYRLRVGDARRFVKEMIGQLESLSTSTEETIVHLCTEEYPLPDQVSFTIRNYLINGTNFRFSYGHPDLEDLIHPAFGYLENKNSDATTGHFFHLFYRGDLILLKVDGLVTWSCAYSRPERFAGLVFLQLLNGINNTTNSHWMGAVHASAVSAGNGAILFAAPSGSGKSTFGAMLMNRGYRILSDDFTPVSLNQPKVYPFPEGISVKNRSLQVLQPYFPSLAEAGDSLPDEVYEVFLPITTNGELPEPEPVKAIVFLQYNPEIEVGFKTINNLEAMDHFLQQLWLPPSAEVASQFMDWFFQIPCYTLQYSDTPKAIESISNLFDP